MKALITFAAVLAFSSASFADDAQAKRDNNGGAQYPEWLISHDG